MNFTVGWDADAENALAVVWLAGPDFLAITRASATVDQLLTLDPVKNGQFLSEGLWRLRVPPLVIHYTIDLSRRHVQVTDVARTV